MSPHAHHEEGHLIVVDTIDAVHAHPQLERRLGRNRHHAHEPTRYEHDAHIGMVRPASDDTCYVVGNRACDIFCPIGEIEHVDATLALAD